MIKQLQVPIAVLIAFLPMKGFSAPHLTPDECISICETADIRCNSWSEYTSKWHPWFAPFVEIYDAAQASGTTAEGICGRKTNVAGEHFLLEGPHCEVTVRFENHDLIDRTIFPEGVEGVVFKKSADRSDIFFTGPKPVFESHSGEKINFSHNIEFITQTESGGKRYIIWSDGTWCHNVLKRRQL